MGATEGATRPRLSTTNGPHTAAGDKSKSPPLNGSMGVTTTASTPGSVTSHQQNFSKTTMIKSESAAAEPALPFTARPIHFFSQSALDILVGTHASVDAVAQQVGKHGGERRVDTAFVGHLHGLS